jgi:hypothetical protein
MEAAKKLPLSAVLFAMLAAVVGAVIGALLGGLIGSLLASAMRVPAREGESGYFIIFIALIAIGLVTPTAVVLTLYWRGVRKWWLLIGSLIAFAGIFAVAGAGFGVWYSAQPHFLNANGPRPLLEFEIKPPEGQSLAALDGVEIELDTDRNVMPASRNEKQAGVRAGFVELYYRTSQRLLVLKFPNREDRLFRLRLPANPMKQRYKEWSAWQK